MPATAAGCCAGRLPPLGWNSWCTGGSCGQPGYVRNASRAGLHDVCNEAEVKQVATAMLDNGMRAAGWSYINLDDCWVDLERTAAGELTWDRSRFPSGIPALIDWLHSRSFLFGLYTAAGNLTCSTGGRVSPTGAKGAPGSGGHYAQDASTFASWGVDYIKLDWCRMPDAELLQMQVIPPAHSTPHMPNQGSTGRR